MGPDINYNFNFNFTYSRPGKWGRLAVCGDGLDSLSVTNTDHCTLGWAIIWTCIKTIYKQCNWPGSAGDATTKKREWERERKRERRRGEKWTGWQIFVPYQQKGFINFCGCNWIFERFLVRAARCWAHLLHWPHIDLLPAPPSAQIARGTGNADGI